MNSITAMLLLRGQVDDAKRKNILQNMHHWHLIASETWMRSRENASNILEEVKFSEYIEYTDSSTTSGTSMIEDVIGHLIVGCLSSL